MQPAPAPSAPSPHPTPQTLPSGGPETATGPPLAGLVICAPTGVHIEGLGTRARIWERGVKRLGGQFTQDLAAPGVTHVLIGRGGADALRQLPRPPAVTVATPETSYSDDDVSSHPCIVSHTWLEEILRLGMRVPEQEHRPRPAAPAPIPLPPVTPAKRRRGPARGLEAQNWLGLELWRPECDEISELELFLQGRYNIDRSRAMGNEPLATTLSELSKYEQSLSSDFRRRVSSRASSADSAGSDRTGGGRGSAGSDASVVVDSEPEGAEKSINAHTLLYARAAAVVRGAAFHVGELDPEGGELPFIGPSTAKYINDILETGSCDPLDRFRTDLVVLDSRGNERPGTAGGATRRLFHRLPGVGQTTAARWFDQGLRNYEDVEAAADDGTLKLSAEQAFSLTHRADLLEGASVEEVTATVGMIRAALAAASGFDGWRAEAVGGVRRGTPGGHDADVLISHPTQNTEGVIKRLCTLLNSGFDPGDGVWRLVPPSEGMCRLQSGLLPDHMDKIKELHLLDPSAAPGRQILDRFDHIYGCVWTPAGRVRRLGVILCPPEEWGFAYLGWVGSRTFLRTQRNYAKADLGMFLNSHGLFVKEGGESKEVPRQAVPRGRDGRPQWPPGWGPGRAMTSEEDVFELLGLPYRPPEDRNCF